VADETIIYFPAEQNFDADMHLVAVLGTDLAQICFTLLQVRACLGIRVGWTGLHFPASHDQTG
jgi:hypothetical protein